MATISIYSVKLQCDGCGKQLNDGEHFASAMDARGVGYGKGWRFPALLSKATGRPLSNRNSDVCPECLTGWENKTGTRQSYRERRDGSVRPNS
ncbi:hypothetical protein [Streptomyces sp. NPDC047028]|uniref:hypothetical protein n=1 Tax=Streptomyces sp. NPDC047028 TaxID=3155793 RepID=UPI0033F98157